MGRGLLLLALPSFLGGRFFKNNQAELTDRRFRGVHPLELQSLEDGKERCLEMPQFADESDMRPEGSKTITSAWPKALQKVLRAEVGGIIHELESFLGCWLI